ncbi:MAG: MFS transporter [Thermoguttaceae bacterium]
MESPLCSRWPIAERRRARRLAVWNGAMWAVGNGLASTTLILYLAKELHAERFGLGIGLILAAPNLIGLLRLGAPAMIDRLGDRKRFCVATFLAGALLLMAIPWLCVPGRLPSAGGSLAMMVALWCLYHLFQYLGMVGLWSWLADVASSPVRGRFLGWRERWLVAGQAGASVAAGLIAWKFSEWFPEVPAWKVYAVLGELGAMGMIASLVPLGLMPERPKNDARRRLSGPGDGEKGFSRWVVPFRDARFLRLLAFGCWFSFFNGLTQSAQNYYPMQVLGISLLLSLTAQTGMRLGQCGVSPWLGELADRRGNRPVMIVSQLLVAAGLLFFAAATPAHWGWFLGAWVFWVAYAGLNVCLPNLMLKLSPDRSNATHIAAFQAVTGLCYALSTIAGGAMVDAHLSQRLVLAVPFFPAFFVFGWIMRSFGALLLAWVLEPKPKSWR